MLPAESGRIFGEIFAYLLFGFVVSCFFKQKKDKLIAFIVTIVIILFGKYGDVLREEKAPTQYKTEISQQKSVELRAEKGKVHVSRTEDTNGQQIYLDKCNLSADERNIYENNMEFQKAFFVTFSIKNSDATLRELSKKCNNLDLLNTTNKKRQWLDKEFATHKAIFIKHMGQAQYDCFEQNVLKDFNDKMAPAVAGAMYSQLQQQASGRMTVCSLMMDNVFQTEMYAGFVENIEKVINTNNAAGWKLIFDPNLPQENSFDIHMSDKGAYIK